MQIKIDTSDAEQIAVLREIERLQGIRHIRYMSQKMIAEGSGIKPTKVRAVLCDLLDAGHVEAIKTTDKPKCPRFFYTVTDSGKNFIAPR